MSTVKDKVALEDAEVSYYKNAWGDNDSQAFLTVREWLEGILMGTWMTHVLNVRAHLANKDKYSEFKKNGPAVTPGAKFAHRKKRGEISYTTLMVIDLDHLDQDRQAVKALMKIDPYVYAVFDSIGGQGLCLLFRVDVTRWDESFLGIQEYLGKKYGLFEKFDQSGKDISRLRFVSYDPDCSIKTSLPAIFKEYPKKEPKPKPIPQTFIDTPEDFDFVFQQVIDTGVDITPYYQQRLKVCFALIDKFGEGGWPYFNRICQNHGEYDEKKTERMWKSAMGYGAQKVTIKTFYYFCKEAQLDIARPFTREVTSIAAAHKKQGGTVAGTVDTLKKMNGFDPAETEPIIRQVYECREEFKTEETLFDQLEFFLRTNYQLRFNEVRRVFEDERDKSIEDADLYKMYINARKTVDDNLKYQDFFMLIHSHMVFPKVHPIKEFFSRNAHLKPVGVIDKLIESIDTDTGFEGTDFTPSYAGRYIRKWLIGFIATIYGDPSALVLIFTGAPNTGKTSWFRQLLPLEIESYRYESTWPDNRDEQGRMCTNLLSFNDEFDGKDKSRMEHFRGLTTKDYFTIREPYGKKDVRLRRLAVMCGTSNPKNVIDQPEHNRRIIPINVLKVMWDIYNAIDRTELLMEAYHAYMAGERPELTNEDIQELRQLTEEFQNKTIEQQLVDQYLSLPTGEGGETVQYLSATEILARLELRVNNRKLNLNQLGAALQASGFIRKNKKVLGKSNKLYSVIVLE